MVWITLIIFLWCFCVLSENGNLPIPIHYNCMEARPAQASELLVLCSTEESKSNGFGTTRWWVNDCWVNCLFVWYKPGAVMLNLKRHYIILMYLSITWLMIILNCCCVAFFFKESNKQATFFLQKSLHLIETMFIWM